jgi:hypothetical protein
MLPLMAMLDAAKSAERMDVAWPIYILKQMPPSRQWINGDFKPPASRQMWEML